MSVTFSRLWIHAIWSVKNQFPAFNPVIGGVLTEIMRREFEQINCFVREA